MYLEFKDEMLIPGINGEIHFKGNYAGQGCILSNQRTVSSE
jgi:hypothetical protein